MGELAVALYWGDARRTPEQTLVIVLLEAMSDILAPPGFILFLPITCLTGTALQLRAIDEEEVGVESHTASLGGLKAGDKSATSYVMVSRLDGACFHHSAVLHMGYDRSNTGPRSHDMQVQADQETVRAQLFPA